ncbi:YkgJ family cysteine cluster protein [Candidatus Peregrinibacteria bacterium]|nr:MAG: YkgJ family cysteine cluster protein [Candidatus Peregrinibacteria bacterium]
MNNRLPVVDNGPCNGCQASCCNPVVALFDQTVDVPYPPGQLKQTSYVKLDQLFEEGERAAGLVRDALASVRLNYDPKRFNPIAMLLVDAGEDTCTFSMVKQRRARLLVALQCRSYDADTQLCTDYDSRPDFCRDFSPNSCGRSPMLGDDRVEENLERKRRFETKGSLDPNEVLIEFQRSLMDGGRPIIFDLDPNKETNPEHYIAHRLEIGRLFDQYVVGTTLARAYDQLGIEPGLSNARVTLTSNARDIDNKPIVVNEGEELVIDYLNIAFIDRADSRLASDHPYAYTYHGCLDFRGQPGLKLLSLAAGGRLSSYAYARVYVFDGNGRGQSYSIPVDYLVHKKSDVAKAMSDFVC